MEGRNRPFEQNHQCLEPNYLFKRIKEGEREERENEYIEGITIEWGESIKGESSLVLNREWIHKQIRTNGKLDIYFISDLTVRLEAVNQ